MLHVLTHGSTATIAWRKGDPALIILLQGATPPSNNTPLRWSGCMLPTVDQTWSSRPPSSWLMVFISDQISGLYDLMSSSRHSLEEPVPGVLPLEEVEATLGHKHTGTLYWTATMALLRRYSTGLWKTFGGRIFQQGGVHFLLTQRGIRERPCQ